MHQIFVDLHAQLSRQRRLLICFTDHGLLMLLQYGNDVLSKVSDNYPLHLCLSPKFIDSFAKLFKFISLQLLQALRNSHGVVVENDIQVYISNLVDISTVKVLILLHQILPCQLEQTLSIL